MATKSFLSAEEESEARARFLPPRGLGLALSAWLDEVLTKKFAAIPGWEGAGPIALGSWARGELCPKSDIDMIFTGPEEVVQQVVGVVQARGLRLRSRVPLNPNDWTEGVEAFDILAILNGRAFSAETAKRLAEQQDMIRDRGHVFAQSLLKAIRAEKESRRLRFDSVAHYLEPNIKFGPGGLRDLEQALAIRQLFSPRFVNFNDPFVELSHYKLLWLSIRQWLHLHGGGDLIAGPDQPELARAFGFADLHEFMREFQRGIAKVNFHSEWALAMATSRPRRPRRLKSFNDALRAFERDHSVLMQAEVLKAMPELKAPADLAAYFRPTQAEAWFQALFDSQLIDHWFKDVARLRGWVQHDHYHRFTADQHLLRALRLVARARRSPKLIGRLKALARKFSERDWQILLWTALFHDLAKGLGGDHATKGSGLVDREMARLELSEDVAREVKWMVANHLLLSSAAFRRNVQEPTTWQHLAEGGAEGARLKRLAVFTALDILATNPEAWNEWKERLLFDLVMAMEGAQTSGYMTVLKGAGPKLGAELAAHLDPSLSKAIPAKRLLADLKRTGRAKRDLAPLIVRNRRGETWVRFHSRRDRAGLFLEYVTKLYALGCSVQQAAVRTIPHVGVYDWFQVRTSKTAKQIEKQLALIENWRSVEAPTVRLQRIEVVSHSSDGWILSFRGPDQKGVLLATAKALFDLGMTIRWAKVITWGDQIDDVFAVEGVGNKDAILAELGGRFSAEVEGHA